MTPTKRRCPVCDEPRLLAEFQQWRGDKRAGRYTKCQSCRDGYTPEQLAEARTLYESGADLLIVATAVNRAGQGAVHRLARVNGWDTVARGTAKAAPQPKRQYKKRDPDAIAFHRGPQGPVLAGRGEVHIRCHHCQAHRVATTASVCHVCGRSGAVPLSEFEEAA